MSVELQGPGTQTDGHATYMRNLAFALQERLAFTSLLEPLGAAPQLCSAASHRAGQSAAEASAEQPEHRQGSGCATQGGFPLPSHPPPPAEVVQALQLQLPPEPQVAWLQHPDLARARHQLQATVTNRVLQLQLLADWPLALPRRSPAAVQRLLEEAEERGVEGAAWQALGLPDSPLLLLPELPELVRKDVLGSLDLLLALAGHLSPPQSGSTEAAPHPPAGPLANIHPLLQAKHPGSSRSSQGRGAGSSGGASKASGPPCPSLMRSQGGLTLPLSLACVPRLPALASLQPPTLEWLKLFFSDLAPPQRHVGVDDRQLPWFRQVKVAAARALVHEGSLPLCRSFAKFGVPHGCRSGVWEVALGLRPGPLTAEEEAEWAGRVQEACAQPLLADLWVEADLALVKDSPHFFLFEEMLRAVSLAFLHDPQVPSHCSVPQHPALGYLPPRTAVPPSRDPHPASSSSSAPSDQAAGGPSPSQSACSAAPAGAKGQQGQQPSVAVLAATACPYPPNGSVQLGGAVLLVAPLCFMYSNPAAVYRMHRSLYCRYWVKLHSLSLDGLPSPALPLLLRTYEDLLLELEPELSRHLQHLGMPLAALALPWITRAFVGYLPVEEVLLLWDRIIGLDSLLPLALLAAAVVCFRRQVLLSCQSSREVLEVMADLQRLQTVPLLQAMLFNG
ncbi:hypothetical protein QJQ45_004919 [Haematococcus lacustris]|nr:hypothetical protein QJQ45_004919 [Haematococcus lacustris]